MEGVLVSAKKADSAVTVTVVSDDKGRYSFPADRLEPGRYTISIRAIGYKLDGPKTADVAAGTTATADLKLSPVKNLVTQLSSGEWLNSLPGEPKQKAFLTMCVGCHTLQRVLTSTHSPAEFEQVFLRMSRYSPGSTPTHPQPLLPGPRGERPRRHRRRRQGRGGISREPQRSAMPRRPNTSSSRCRVRRAAPPASSSPNTTCRAKRRSRTT